MLRDVIGLVWAVALLLLVALLVLRVRQVQRALAKRDARRAPPLLTDATALVQGRDTPTRRLTLPELVRLPQAPAILLSKPPPTRHPIVLAHGYFGFASVGVLNTRRDYFVGVRERLQALGYTVYLARLSPAASINLRAAQLARQIEALPAERVNVIAHSMGGLDARYAIGHLGLGPRIASLTTIGTPHHGTPLADTSALFIGEWTNVRRMLHTIGANVDGLYDLTTRKMEEFNRLVPDATGVLYSSVVGAVTSLPRPVNTLLYPGHAYLARLVGPNDGMVPAHSQKWGEVVGEIDADHWEQIGWSRRFDALTFYAVLAEHLAQWGL